MSAELISLLLRYDSRLAKFGIQYFYQDEKLQKLREEIDNKMRGGRLSDPLKSQEAQHMPYLQAVIKEGLRMHPDVGQMLARIVSTNGAHIAGHYFSRNLSAYLYETHHSIALQMDQS